MGHKLLHGGIFMNMTYDVMFCGKTVGNVHLVKQGLYYHLQCSCSMISREIYRLQVQCGQERIRCGILIPENNRFVLETKIPAKKLYGDDLEFWLENISSCGNVTSHLKGEFKYIPIYPDEPFTYLTKLKHAYFEKRNAQGGILIRE